MSIEGQNLQIKAWAQRQLEQRPKESVDYLDDDYNKMISIIWENVEKSVKLTSSKKVRGNETPQSPINKRTVPELVNRILGKPKAKSTIDKICNGVDFEYLRLQAQSLPLTEELIREKIIRALSKSKSPEFIELAGVLSFPKMSSDDSELDFNEYGKTWEKETEQDQTQELTPTIPDGGSDLDFNTLVSEDNRSPSISKLDYVALYLKEDSKGKLEDLIQILKEDRQDNTDLADFVLKNQKPLIQKGLYKDPIAIEYLSKIIAKMHIDDYSKLVQKFQSLLGLLQEEESFCNFVECILSNYLKALEKDEGISIPFISNILQFTKKSILETRSLSLQTFHNQKIFQLITSTLIKTISHPEYKNFKERDSLIDITLEILEIAKSNKDLEAPLKALLEQIRTSLPPFIKFFKVVKQIFESGELVFQLEALNYIKSYAGNNSPMKDLKPYTDLIVNLILQLQKEDVVKELPGFFCQLICLEGSNLQIQPQKILAMIEFYCLHKGDLNVDVVKATARWLIEKCMDQGEEEKKTIEGGLKNLAPNFSTHRNVKSFIQLLLIALSPKNINSEKVNLFDNDELSLKDYLEVFFSLPNEKANLYFELLFKSEFALSQDLVNVLGNTKNLTPHFLNWMFTKVLVPKQVSFDQSSPQQKKSHEDQIEALIKALKIFMNLLISDRNFLKDEELWLKAFKSYAFASSLSSQINSKNVEKLKIFEDCVKLNLIDNNLSVLENILDAGIAQVIVFPEISGEFKSFLYDIADLILFNSTKQKGLKLIEKLFMSCVSEKSKAQNLFHRAHINRFYLDSEHLKWQHYYYCEFDLKTLKEKKLDHLWEVQSGTHALQNLKTLITKLRPQKSTIAFEKACLILQNLIDQISNHNHIDMIECFIRLYTASPEKQNYTGAFSLVNIGLKIQQKLSCPDFNSDVKKLIPAQFYGCFKQLVKVFIEEKDVNVFSQNLPQLAKSLQQLQDLQEYLQVVNPDNFSLEFFTILNSVFCSILERKDKIAALEDQKQLQCLVDFNSLIYKVYNKKTLAIYKAELLIFYRNIFNIWIPLLAEYQINVSSTSDYDSEALCDWLKHMYKNDIKSFEAVSSTLKKIGGKRFPEISDEMIKDISINIQ